MASDEELVSAADYVLSIVPPRDVVGTAERVLKAIRDSGFKERESPLYYLDLNAKSPQLARDTADLFKEAEDSIRFLDGGIVGAPPAPKEGKEKLDDVSAWQRPSIPLSGPHPLHSATPNGTHLATALNTKHISTSIGAASGLKMCFGSLTKGLTALAIQSFTTAHRLDVLPELQEHLKEYSPKTWDLASKSLTVMPPKAYRWVREMEEIAATFEVDGGFTKEESVFGGVARTYGLVADGTELGKEKTGERKRGRTAEDVALLMSEGIERRKVKTD